MGRKTNTGGFYAVAIGVQPGVYESWPETNRQVHGYPYARHKKFPTREEAEDFIASHKDEVVSNRNASGIHQAYYAVAKGRASGVYRSWKECHAQTKDMYSASYKKFTTMEDSEKFIDNYRRLREADPNDPDPMDPTTLVAFCDGSAVNNGKPNCRAGWACVSPHNPNWKQSAPLAHHLLHQPTNNRAEYRAAIEAMKLANKEDPEKVKPLYICTDSELLARSMTEWLPGWTVGGWIRSDGEPVKNQDLLKWMVELKGERRIIWRWTKAHTNRRGWWSKWNAVADQMAREQTHNKSTFPGPVRQRKGSGSNKRAYPMDRQQTHDWQPTFAVEERRVRPRHTVPERLPTDMPCPMP